MNEQALAIVNGAIAQLNALAATQQGEVDADKLDAADAQARLDKDNADIVTKSADVDSTNKIAASLQALVNPPAPAAAPEG